MVPVENLDELIILAHQKHSASDANWVCNLSVSLGIPAARVRAHAHKLGVLQRGNRVAWLKTEDDILREHPFSALEAQECLQSAGYFRTLSSVTGRMYRLEFKVQADDAYTIVDIAKMLGVHEKTAMSWFRRGSLPPATRGTKRGAAAWTASQIKKFMLENIMKWDSAKIDKYFLVEILRC